MTMLSTVKTGRWSKKLSDGNCTLAVSPNRFIGYDFEQITSAGDPALGIQEGGLNAGQRVDPALVGFAFLEIGAGGVDAGDDIASDNAGKGVVAGPGDAINAVALADADAGDVIEVQIVKKGVIADNLTGIASQTGSWAPIDVTLVGGTKDTVIAGLPANAKFIIARHTIGGSAGNLTYVTTVAGTLTVNSSSGTDTSVVTCQRVA
jgi:hypothetical protein